MEYHPTKASLQAHALPDWYHDAKLGIFVHWGPYSVPGWAPTTRSYDQVTGRQGWAAWFAQNPYAEWYQNSLRFEGSPTRRYHDQTFGPDFAYERFAAQFNQAVEAWDPAAWAGLFRQAGARYVVLTSKHHDGFLLWPSRQPNPHEAGYQARRDLVGELSAAVRAQDLRMGLYYSGGLDWTFNPAPILDIVDLMTTIPQGVNYVEYATNHWRELIERYGPEVLWNDIGYPGAADLKALFAHYYNQIPTGVVNDRWAQFKWGDSRLFQAGPIRGLMARLLSRAISRGGTPPPGVPFDFRTTEYASFDDILLSKWEATRGIGYSFGFNRAEGDEHSISLPDLVHLLVDVVSKNGNLLLNVGPRADGTIPELQRQRLLGLGHWLDVNGPAIFGTRPWVHAAGRTIAGDPVRFTQDGTALYAIVLGRPVGARLTFESLLVDDGASVHLLGHDDALPWQQVGEDLTITLPQPLPDSPAYAFRLALASPS
jgi:alpha-L-fucosidase